MNPGLLERLLAVPFTERDAWVDALLGLPEAPPDIGQLPRGAVPYLPAGVDDILAVVREAPVLATDHFVDVGSGLGRVAMLVHLLTGARATGIELQAPLVDAARRCSERLGLSAVRFIQADARTQELDGTVFFFYAPFALDTLRSVLQRLETHARQTQIKLCTVGFELPSAPWFHRVPSSNVAVALYHSRRES